MYEGVLYYDIPRNFGRIKQREKIRKIKYRASKLCANPDPVGINSNIVLPKGFLGSEPDGRIYFFQVLVVK